MAGCSFVHASRSSLLPGFSVRLASHNDRAGVQALVDGMPNASDIISAYSDALVTGSAAVAVCEGEVVGVCTVNPAVDLALLKANFALNAHIDLALHKDASHGEVDMYCINPIFAHL